MLPIRKLLKLQMQKQTTLDAAKAAISVKYHCGPIIGRGASAYVYLMTHRASQKQYARKMIAKNQKLNDDKTMQMEMYLLQHIQDDHLVNWTRKLILFVFCGV